MKSDATIYLDMDGVLTSFMDYCRHIGIPDPKPGEYDDKPKEEWSRQTVMSEKAREAAMNTKGFWRNMTMMPDAPVLWEGVKDLMQGRQPFVITARPRDNSPEWIGKEKYGWIRENLEPEYDPGRFTICLRREKTKFIGQGPGIQILVDDDKLNCKAWEDAGGYSILHTRATISLKAIQELLNDRTAY